MMELGICEGDFGLSSLDSDCLQLLLLAKVSKVPLNIVSHQINYPVFIHNSFKMKDFLEVKSYLFKLGYSSDFLLDETQKSEAYAMINMLKNYITPILKYLWWINEFNYENFSSKWMLYSVRFPFNFIGLRKLKNEAIEYLELKYPNHSFEDIKIHLLKDLKECIPVFARKLSRQPYFFGSNISSVDIVLYGYMAPILKIPFPENEFKEIIESYPIFSHFITRMNAAYFPEIQYTEKYIKTAMFGDETEKGHERLVFVFGFMVALGMVTYTMSKSVWRNLYKTTNN